jgi:hypothetical protein
MLNPKNERQDYYALHISGYFGRVMAPGDDLFVYHGRFYPRSFGDCRCGHSASAYQRTKDAVTLVAVKLENRKDTSMNKLISLAILTVGIVLVIYGVSASESLSSDFSRFFTGSPTDKTIWLLISGIVAIAIGLGGFLRGQFGHKGVL